MTLAPSPSHRGTHNLDDTVYVLEALLLDLERLHVILEVTVVERQAQAVEAQGFEELGILLRKEMLEKLGQSIPQNRV